MRRRSSPGAVRCVSSGVRCVSFGLTTSINRYYTPLVSQRKDLCDGQRVRVRLWATKFTISQVQPPTNVPPNIRWLSFTAPPPCGGAVRCATRTQRTSGLHLQVGQDSQTKAGLRYGSSLMLPDPSAGVRSETVPRLCDGILCGHATDGGARQSPVKRFRLCDAGPVESVDPGGVSIPGPTTADDGRAAFLGGTVEHSGNPEPLSMALSRCGRRLL